MNIIAIMAISLSHFNGPNSGHQYFPAPATFGYNTYVQLHENLLRSLSPIQLNACRSENYCFPSPDTPCHDEYDFPCHNEYDFPLDFHASSIGVDSETNCETDFETNSETFFEKEIESLPFSKLTLEKSKNQRDRKDDNHDEEQKLVIGINELFDVPIWVDPHSTFRTFDNQFNVRQKLEFFLKKLSNCVNVSSNWQITNRQHKCSSIYTVLTLVRGEYLKWQIFLWQNTTIIPSPTPINSTQSNQSQALVVEINRCSGDIIDFYQYVVRPLRQIIVENMDPIHAMNACGLILHN